MYFLFFSKKQLNRGKVLITQHIKKKKIIQTMMEYRHVCVFNQAHSTPNGVKQTEVKTDYKKV